MIVNNKNYKSEKGYVKILNGKLYQDYYPFSTETLNIISKARSLGYTLPDIPTTIAIDTLIADMKSIGVWTTNDIYRQFAYNNLSLDLFSLIDWKNPERALTTRTGDYIYTVNGYTAGGTSGFLDTVYNPATEGVNYTLNSARRSYVVISPGNATIEAAGSTANNRTSLTAAGSTTQRINQGTNLINAAVNISGNGYTAIMRLDSTNIKFIKKDLEFDRTAASTSINSNNQHLLRTQSVFSTNTLLSYSMGAPITYTQSQLYRAAYNKFLRTLGLVEYA